MSSRDLDYMIAVRLDNFNFPLCIERDIMLVNNYHLRGAYKSAGAKYNGDLKRWQFLAGSDLRPVLSDHLEWPETPEFVYREALFMTLSKINEIEDLF
ncbi:MAG: hypothetical protein ACKPKO_35925 [Candidatus Fonsibacter sp.]